MTSAIRKVLVVDDSESMRRIVRHVLETAPVQIFESCFAKEAIPILLRESIDLLITDENMLGIDGLEFTRVLRSLDAFDGLPILLLSNGATETGREEALRAGVNVWVPKSAPFEELKRQVELML